MKEQYNDGEGELFRARVLELMVGADRGEISVSEFYNPREMYRASSILTGAGYRGRFAFYGGYKEAERARLVCLPEYALYDVSPTDGDALWQAAADLAGEDVSVLFVKGSGYKTLSHRDFMGSVLALGIKRGCIGDIAAEGNDAYIFCDSIIADYIVVNLTRVGRDAVKITKTVLPPDFKPRKRTETVTDTVASMRADCVIAALTNCSRERAKELLRAGLCELDYETLYKPDATVAPGSILSVRGKGKFRIIGEDGETKRGRLRISAEKYI